MKTSTLQVVWDHEDDIGPLDLADVMSSPIVTDVKTKSMKVDIKKAAATPKELLRILGMFQAMSGVTVKLTDVPPTKLKIVTDILSVADWAKDHTLKVRPKGKKHADISFGIQVLRARHRSQPSNLIRMRKLLQTLL